MSSLLTRKNFLKNSITSAIIAVCCGTNVYAEQTETEPKNKEIERITVVGATTNSEITPEELKSAISAKTKILLYQCYHH